MNLPDKVGGVGQAEELHMRRVTVDPTVTLKYFQNAFLKLAIVMTLGLADL